MKRNFCHLIFVLFICTGNFCHAQYSISGYLDTEEKNKRVYLSLLGFDERTAISDKQIITSTVADSSGYFSFEGKLLSDKHALYRIHSNLEEGLDGLEKIDEDQLKNFHNFVFSNTDTIVFKKNTTHWFSTNSNTNPVDKEWRDFSAYANQLQREFYGITDVKVKDKSSNQLLGELKSYAKEKDVHPLVTLVLIADVQKNTLKRDFENDREFYNKLNDTLGLYYGQTSYAKQFNDLITDFTKQETQQNLDFYRNTTYIMVVVCVLLLAGLGFLVFRLKRIKNQLNYNPDISLTSQEERVAELIVQEKSNKEIAAELFISLSTVKTHVRNLYAKLEVNNRRDFLDKFKNHPRD